MKSIQIIILLFFSATSFAIESERPEREDYAIISNVLDESISANTSKFIFQINGIRNSIFYHGEETFELVYSINNEIDTTQIDDNLRLENLVKPGIYKFQFFYSLDFKEIFINKIEIKEGYCMTIALNFKSTNGENIMVKKPVIYLYPEVSTLVEVKVVTKGKLIFTYPIYENSWKVNASPSGELTLNDLKYNYLFWESQQNLGFKDFDLTTGFVVSKEETIHFLEDKLSKYGLNSKEQADFITFWGPQMMKHNSNFVHFIINEDCDLFATLKVNPKPEKVFRIYLVFYDLKDLKFTELKPQEITLIQRMGFTLLEWGGVELENNSSQTSKVNN